LIAVSKSEHQRRSRLHASSAPSRAPAAVSMVPAAADTVPAASTASASAGHGGEHGGGGHGGGGGGSPRLRSSGRCASGRTACGRGRCARFLKRANTMPTRNAGHVNQPGYGFEGPVRRQDPATAPQSSRIPETGSWRVILVISQKLESRKTRRCVIRAGTTTPPQQALNSAVTRTPQGRTRCHRRAGGIC